MKIDNRDMSEIANTMNRYPVDIFFNFGRENVNKLEVLPIKPSINVDRNPQKQS